MIPLLLLALSALATTPQELVSTEVSALVEDAELDDSELDALSSHSDWRVRQRAALVTGWRTWPELYAEHAHLPLRSTRLGVGRFLGETVTDPRLLPLHLERLVSGGEPEEVRMGLVDLLPRCGGDWEQAAVELLGTEPSPAVRGMLVATMKQARDSSLAHEALRLGMSDAHAHVRAEAARITGWRPDGAGLADELVQRVDDEDPSVRVAAVRALGWLEVDHAYGAIRHRLGDDNATVRLRALRALERIDPDRTTALRELKSLSQDADPKVRRAAVQIHGE